MKKQYLVIMFSVFMLFAGNSYSANKKTEPEIKADVSFENRVAKIFYVEKTVLLGLRDLGYNEEESLRIIFINVTSGIPITEITNLYKQGIKWDDIAEKFGVDVDIFNKEIVNILIYLGIVKKMGLPEKKGMDSILNPELNYEK